MEESFLALDFGSGHISAVLMVYDEKTGTCRVQYATRISCPSISTCYILDFDRTVRTLSQLITEMCEYAKTDPVVVVGLRGDFLSFRRSGGFQPITSADKLVTDKDVQTALDNSVPENLNPDLEIVDLLPQSYTLDGKTGIKNPVGLQANCLESETFLSCGLRTHLNNLNRVMAAVGYEDFEAVPTVLALCGSLLKAEEKQNGVLLLDIGAQNSSAALYHKGMLEAAWEIPFGAEIGVQEVADVLQNDLEEARKTLLNYTYGDDEIMDDLLDEAACKFLKVLHQELVQSLSYIKYPPRQVVLTGGGAEPYVKNAVKTILGARRVRLATYDHLIADDQDLLAPAYTSALSLALHSQRHGGNLRTNKRSDKKNGLFNKLLTKLGLN